MRMNCKLKHKKSALLSNSASLEFFCTFCIEFRHLKRTGLKIAIFELISMNFESEVVEFPNRFFNCVYQIGFSMDCL